MNTDFQVVALPDMKFQRYFEMSDEQLRKHNARRLAVDKKPGFPCRVSLEDAEVGETVILLNYDHHEAASPYAAAGPIFVRESAETAQLKMNEIPEMIRHRQLSLRAYDASGYMRSAVVLPGAELSGKIREYFTDGNIAYLQVHNAGPGCFNCQIDRI